MNILVEYFFYYALAQILFLLTNFCLNKQFKFNLNNSSLYLVF